MKKLLACILFLSILYSCNTAGSGSPKATVAAFIEASKSGNFDEIKKHITKSDAGLMDLGESFLAKLDSNGAKGMKEKMMKEFKDKTKDAKIEIKEEKIEGDNATVNVAYIHDGKTETHPFSLIKEDGLWKISLLSTGMKNTGSGNENAGDEMKAMNMDSIKAAMSQGMEEFNKMDKDSLKKVMEDAMKELEKLKATPKEK